MVTKVLKDYVELCVSFFASVEKVEPEHCDVYSKSCRICNPSEIPSNQ